MQYPRPHSKTQYFCFVFLLPFTFGLTNVWPPEVKVVAKPAPPKGDGVFACDAISQGAFVCCYKGELLTVEDELTLYPERYPDYCLQISPGLSIDGANSNHWSRLINHNENANLNLITDPKRHTAHFLAARDISAGEELCFDYGVAYFIFRSITSAPGTESRSLTLPTEKAGSFTELAPLSTPKTPDEIHDVMTGQEDMESKKATLMRGLDYYSGVTWTDDEDMVDIPISLDGRRQTVSYAQVTAEYLGDVLANLWNEAQSQKDPEPK